MASVLVFETSVTVYDNYLLKPSIPRCEIWNMLIPYDAHTLSSKGLLEYSNLSERSCNLDLTPNSLNQFTKKRVAARGES